MSREKFVGTINLNGSVTVSDPCYELGTWCAGELDMKPGEYKCYVKMSDEGNWGHRVASIIIKHVDYPDADPQDAEITHVGVDSGQAGFYDSHYYKLFHSEKDINDNWYARACELTLSKEQCGIMDNAGFVSSSGFGDGDYMCYVERNAEQEIVAAEIVFIGEEDE